MDFNLDFNIDPHPQPLSRRERGEKTHKSLIPPLLLGEGVRG